MGTFYLVRHARAIESVEEDRPLSAQGLKDARTVARILEKFPISAIYSSPSLRARQSIAPLAERLKLGVNIEPDLRERLLGDSPGENFYTAKVLIPPSTMHSGSRYRCQISTC
jgi:2,3-bisphosphoglycerate-dependent phosphoglycerate mutase